MQCASLLTDSVWWNSFVEMLLSSKVSFSSNVLCTNIIRENNIQRSGKRGPESFNSVGENTEQHFRAQNVNRFLSNIL